MKGRTVTARTCGSSRFPVPKIEMTAGPGVYNKEIMRAATAEPYRTVPGFRRLGWLAHGFGTAAWSLADFRKAGDWKTFKPVIQKQTHSNIVRRVDRVPDRRLEGDALITAEPGLLLIIKTADCLPVLIADPERRAVAAAHCGWRGTQKRILDGVVRELRSAYGCDPASLRVAFGPSIGPRCYEVGPEVRAAYEAGGFPPGVFKKAAGRPGKYLLDLKKANAWLLKRQGVPAKNMFSVDACTHCDPGLFSYRRDRDKSARMFNFIGIRRPG